MLDLNPKCARCDKRAMVEVFNSYNSSSGKFCRKHGAEQLAQHKAWDRQEAAEIERQREAARAAALEHKTNGGAP
jgi:hypothetical protein